MAGPKHKTRTPREKPNSIAPPHTGSALVVKEPAIDSEQPADQGSRIALAVWLLAFIVLGSFALWDLITALLFR